MPRLYRSSCQAQLGSVERGGSEVLLQPAPKVDPGALSFKSGRASSMGTQARCRGGARAPRRRASGAAVAADWSTLQPWRAGLEIDRHGAWLGGKARARPAAPARELRFPRDGSTGIRRRPSSPGPNRRRHRHAATARPRPRSAQLRELASSAAAPCHSFASSPPQGQEKDREGESI